MQGVWNHWSAVRQQDVRHEPLQAVHPGLHVAAAVVFAQVVVEGDECRDAVLFDGILELIEVTNDRPLDVMGDFNPGDMIWVSNVVEEKVEIGVWLHWKLKKRQGFLPAS